MNGSNQIRLSSWLGFALEDALERGFTEPAEILAHATPDVLAAQLPAEITVRICEASLSTGQINPHSVLAIATPAVLSEHLTPEILLRAMAAAIRRAKLEVPDAPVNETTRGWLQAILERALQDGLVQPEDVLRFVPPAEFVNLAPTTVLAALLREGLKAGRFDASLVVAHVTPQVIAQSVKPGLAWRCITDAALRHFGVELRAEAPSTMSPAVAPTDVEAKGPTGQVVPFDNGRVRKAGFGRTEWTDGFVEPEGVEVLEDTPAPPQPRLR
jgi:hypothetical protein